MAVVAFCVPLSEVVICRCLLTVVSRTDIICVVIVSIPALPPAHNGVPHAATRPPRKGARGRHGAESQSQVYKNEQLSAISAPVADQKLRIMHPSYANATPELGPELLG